MVQRGFAICILANILFGMVWSGNIPWMAIAWIWLGASAHTLERYLKHTNWLARIEKKWQVKNALAQAAIVTTIDVVLMTIWLLTLPRHLIKSILLPKPKQPLHQRVKVIKAK